MTANQEVIVGFQNLLCLLSRRDNLKMFAIAKEGLMINSSTLDTLRITPKKYYTSLKQLKDVGLIEKSKKGYYVHTTFGSIVYQRIILELGQYTRHLEKMQMIDTLRHAGKFSEASILKITQEIMDNIIKPSPSTSTSSFPSAISESIKNKIDIILSFDNVIQTLVERIDCCKREILIATRICPEIVINKILEKSKQGVKVKVVADIDLVKQYFRTQQKFVDNLDKKNPRKERKCVIANPWYPDKTINRRIADIPFGMIVLDNNEVGIELVNSNNPKEFYGGIFIRDEKTAMMAAGFYQQLWEKASESIDGIEE
jgi:DNA-binding PadR family transcriptional regulator